MSSVKFALAVAIVMFAGGSLGLVAAARPAGASYHRRLARHDRRGRRPSHAPVRPGHRPSDLDGLRRLLRPEHADPGSGVEGHAARSCAVRLWAGGQSGARAAPGCAGEDHRSDLGRERERQQFRGRTTSPRRFRTCGPGKRSWRASTPRPTSKRQALAAAMSTSDALAQARMQMSFALTAPVSYPLLLTVVGWVVCLFCGFGLMSRGTVTSVIALAVGSIAVASAVLLILELSTPYSGRVSRFARAIGAGAGGHGEGVGPGAVTASCRGSSLRSDRASP